MFFFSYHANLPSSKTICEIEIVSKNCENLFFILVFSW